MKFLCDNCKAKYQIADDKVAGKTVRMKCRKCGHQIEVRAEVTESSVSSAPPRAPSTPRAPAAKGNLATSLSAQKPKPAAQGGALAGAFQRNVEHAPSPASFAPPPDVSVSVTDEWYVAINGVPVGPVRLSELRRKAAAGAVTDDSLCWQEGLEEWRPVRSIPELAAIVREAAHQARVSLVNPQETRPSSPPKPPPPARPAPQATAPMAPMAPAASAPSPAMAAPLAPLAPTPVRPEPTTRIAASAPAPARSNVVPLHGRITVPSTSDDVGSTSPLAPPMSPLGGSSAALAMAPTPQPTRDPFALPAPPPPAPAPAADPFAVPATPMFSMQQSSPSIVPGMGYGAVEAPQQKKAGVPLWFWPVLVLALAFGGGAAFFVFRQQPPQQIVVQVPVPQAPAAPPTTAKVEDVPPPPTAEPTATAAPTQTGKVASNNGPRNTPTAAPPTTKGGGAADLSGLLGGTSSGSGPNVGPGGGPSGGSGGGLDQAGVERVVAAHRNGVRRTCWERGGSNDQKSSVNVTVSATVAPDGSVSGTSSSGDDPVVAKCIENQVRTWRFPAPGSSTQIAIPFKFVRQ